MENPKPTEFAYTFKNFTSEYASITFTINIPYRGDILELAHEIVNKKMDPIMDMLDAHLGKSAFS